MRVKRPKETPTHIYMGEEKLYISIYIYIQIFHSLSHLVMFYNNALFPKNGTIIMLML